MIKFLTLRQFICPLSLFLKEIPFASLTNAIDVKIERVLTGFFDWLKQSVSANQECFSQSKMNMNLSVLVKYKAEIYFISLNVHVTCSRHDLAEKLLIWH
jgi:hypothetical protein